MAKKSVPALKIAALSDGFRRAGHVFSRTAVVVAISALSKDQLAAIKGDKGLVVTETTLDVDADTEGGKTTA